MGLAGAGDGLGLLHMLGRLLHGLGGVGPHLAWPEQQLGCARRQLGGDGVEVFHLAADDGAAAPALQLCHRPLAATLEEGGLGVGEALLGDGGGQRPAFVDQQVAVEAAAQAVPGGRAQRGGDVQLRAQGLHPLQRRLHGDWVGLLHDAAVEARERQFRKAAQRGALLVRLPQHAFDGGQVVRRAPLHARLRHGDAQAHFRVTPSKSMLPLGDITKPCTSRRMGM